MPQEDIVHRDNAIEEIRSIHDISLLQDVVRVAWNRTKEIQDEIAQEFMVGDVLELPEGFPSNNYVIITNITNGVF